MGAQSTLLLQVAALLVPPAMPAASSADGAAEADTAAEEPADAEVEAGSAVLYVSAEESVEQVRGLLSMKSCSNPNHKPWQRGAVHVCGKEHGAGVRLTSHSVIFVLRRVVSRRQFHVLDSSSRQAGAWHGHAALHA